MRFTAGNGTAGNGAGSLSARGKGYRARDFCGDSGLSFALFQLTRRRFARQVKGPDVGPCLLSGLLNSRCRLLKKIEGERRSTSGGVRVEYVRLCENSETSKKVEKGNIFTREFNDLIPNSFSSYATKWDNMSIIFIRRLLFTQSDVGAKRASATKYMSLFSCLLVFFAEQPQALQHRPVRDREDDRRFLL
jgi:hypothetical protein